MISLAALFLFGWFFFKSVGLAFRVAWCAAKVVAAVLFVVALPLMVGASSNWRCRCCSSPPRSIC